MQITYSQQWIFQHQNLLPNPVLFVHQFQAEEEDDHHSVTNNYDGGTSPDRSEETQEVLQEVPVHEEEMEDNL